MQERLTRLRRIEKLQRRLHELARWRLIALERRHRDLAEARVEMLDALGEGLMAFGGLASAGNRRIRALEVDMAAVQDARDGQAKDAIDQGSRAKLADAALRRAEGEARREAENKSLAELIEISVSGGLSVPRKG